MILTWTETLNSMWENVRLWLPSIISIVVACISAFFASVIKKTMTAETFTEVADKMIDKSYNKIGEISYKVDIQPVLESAVKKYMEEVSKSLDSKIETQTQEEKTTQQLLIYVLQLFSSSRVIDSEQKKEINSYIESLTKTNEVKALETSPIEVTVSTKTDEKEETTDVSIDR